MARRRDRVPEQAPLPFGEGDPWLAPRVKEAVQDHAERVDHDPELAQRIDDYVNRLTGLGDYLQDKVLGGSMYGLDFTLRYVSGYDAENRWRGSDLGARIIETIPAEMTRQGWNIIVQSDEQGDENELKPKLDPNGQPIIGPDGKPVMEKKPKPQLGPDGKPVLGPDGKPVMEEPEEVQLGPDGKPIEPEGEVDDPTEPGAPPVEGEPKPEDGTEPADPNAPAAAPKAEAPDAAPVADPAAPGEPVQKKAAPPFKKADAFPFAKPGGPGAAGKAGGAKGAPPFGKGAGGPQMPPGMHPGMPGAFGPPEVGPPKMAMPDVDDAGSKISEATEGKLDELGAGEAFLLALQYQRAYGGGAILIGADDGHPDLTEPLDEERISAVRYLTPLQGGREGEIVAWSYYRNPKAPKYGEPEIYMVRNIGVPLSNPGVGNLGAAPGREEIPESVFWVHESRLLIFPGTPVSRRARVQMRGWGDSVFTRVEEVLAQYSQTWSGIANLMTDFKLDVLSTTGLVEKLAGNNQSSKGNPLTKRARLIQQTRSIARMHVVDKDKEELKRETVSVAGVSEVLQQFSLRLAAAADMPVTLLMGQAPAGLNATGASDIRFFYDRIASWQERVLVPRLKRLVRLIFLSKEGPTHGKEPETWDVKCKSLYQLSEKEQAELRKIDAETDTIRIADGVLQPEEVAASAYGGSEYSSDRQIDFEGRQQMAAQEEAERQERMKANGLEPVNPKPELGEDGKPKPGAPPFGKKPGQEAAGKAATAKLSAQPGAPTSGQGQEKAVGQEPGEQHGAAPAGGPEQKGAAPAGPPAQHGAAPAPAGAPAGKPAPAGGPEQKAAAPAGGPAEAKAAAPAPAGDKPVHGSKPGEATAPAPHPQQAGAPGAQAPSLTKLPPEQLLPLLQELMQALKPAAPKADTKDLVDCVLCEGTGELEGKECPGCDGEGEFYAERVE